MQSHASRHVVSEFLKDLHPDLSLPFEKVGQGNSKERMLSGAWTNLTQVVYIFIAGGY